MPGNRWSWAAAGAARDAAAATYERDHPAAVAVLTAPVSPSRELVHVQRATSRALAPRVDGDTITIILLQGIVGLGARGDVLTVVQNAEIDALFAIGWAALYTGPVVPTTPVVAVSTGPQDLTSGQQTQAQANIGLPALLGTYAPGGSAGNIGTSPGLDPTGTTDSTSGLRAAAAAATASGTPLLLAPGTYLVATTDLNGIFVALTKGIAIRALIPRTVTIKIANSVTRWWSIFGAKSSGVDLTDLLIEGIDFDCNSGVNAWTPATIGDRTTGYPRYIVSGYRGDRMTARNCRVKNFDGSNAFVFNTESTGGYDARVENCVFTNVGSTCYHDHSTIFLSAKGVHCHNNHGVGITPSAGVASNAICFAELHGSDIYESGNTSEYFAVGTNICTADTAHNLNGASAYSVHDNHWLHCGIGHQLWPYQDMSGFDIHDNEVTVDVDFWANGLPLNDGTGGVTAVRHSPVVVVPGLAGSVNGRVHDDRWSYSAWTSTPSSVDNAVQFARTTTADNPDSLEITDITATNLPAAFIRYTGYLSARRLRVERIRIRNLGVAGLGSGLQTVAYLAFGGPINDFSLDVTVVDDQTTASCQQILQVDNIDAPAPTMPGVATLSFDYWFADGTSPTGQSGIHIPERHLTGFTQTDLGRRNVWYGPPTALETSIRQPNPLITGPTPIDKVRDVNGNDLLSVHSTRGTEHRDLPAPTWRGAWVAGTVYWRGDVVTNSGITWISNQVAQFTSGATFDPTNWMRLSGGKNFGIVTTVPPYVVDSPITIGTANDCRFMRVLDEGDIASVRLHVSVSSGNIAVAAYRNSGSGRSAAPGTRLATSGAVTCPVVGDADVSLGATVHVYEGDWLAISCDNVTATFFGVSGGSGVSTLQAGVAYVQTAAHPCPAVPTSLSAQNNRLIALGGV